MSQINMEILDNFSKKIIKEVTNTVSKNILDHLSDFPNQISGKINNEVVTSLNTFGNSLSNTILPNDVVEKIKNIYQLSSSLPTWFPNLINIVGIIVVIIIFFTQSEKSSIKLKAKDASLILVLLAFMAYINGYEKLFILFLVSFLIIYFLPMDKISNLFGKNKKKVVRRIRRIDPEEYEQEPVQEQEVYDEMESQSENEITLDTDIEEENVEMEITKKQ